MFSLILSLIAIGVIAGFFWAMRQIVDIKADSVAATLQSMQTSMRESEAGQEQEKINKLNRAVNTQAALIKEQLQWTPLLEKLLAVTPPGVDFVTLTGDSEEMTLTINGQAQTRQQLIDFQDALEDMDITKELDAPLSNIIERESVPFDITILLEPGTLKSPDAQKN